MDKAISTFGDIETENFFFFYCNKTPVPLKNIDIEKVLVSTIFPLVKKAINTLLVIGII